MTTSDYVDRGLISTRVATAGAVRSLVRESKDEVEHAEHESVIHFGTGPGRQHTLTVGENHVELRHVNGRQLNFTDREAILLCRVLEGLFPGYEDEAHFPQEARERPADVPAVQSAETEKL